MSDHNKFKNESQDARRHDQQHVVHPGDKVYQSNEKSKSKEHSHSKDSKKKKD